MRQRDHVRQQSKRGNAVPIQIDALQGRGLRRNWYANYTPDAPNAHIWRTQYQRALDILALQWLGMHPEFVATAAGFRAGLK